MNDRRMFVDYRIWVVRIGLTVSWLLLGGFGVLAARDLEWRNAGVWAPIAGGGAILLLLTVVPWRRVLPTALGELLLALWAATALGGLLAAEQLRPQGPLIAAYAIVVVGAAALLVLPVTQGLIAAAGIATYAVALDGTTADTLEVGLRIATLGGIGLLTLSLSYSTRLQLDTAARRLEELDALDAEVIRKESEMERLYALSRTIGLGTNLAEVLPEIVGRVVDAVDAKLGLAMLYNRQEQALEVISPIWVAGHTLRAEGYYLSLTTAGLAQRVFVGDEPALQNEILDTDALLADLDMRNVAAVPLRIEQRTIGVLMVGDKTAGDFSPTDLEMLESLAAPSALVLNQMARLEEAKETSEKMSELAKLKTDFVSVVSHELRTPLTSIIGALKTLVRPELAPTDPNALDLLSSAMSQANRLRMLIEDLLVVSRLDNRALPVRPQQIELDAILSEIIAAIPGAGATVNISAPADLPTVETDPEHLRRILTNLVENGIKYAGQSPVEVSARNSGSEVWISVVDHGPGIPYELHDHVFDRFTQVERPETRAVGGTGLGLSIVRGLSEAIGGRVWFEPTIGGGATFTLALPRTARSYSSIPLQEPKVSGL